MTRLFIREASIILGDRLFKYSLQDPNVKSLSFAFKVKRTLKPAPNTLELNVRNLARETLALLKKPQPIPDAQKKRTELLATIAKPPDKNATPEQRAEYDKRKADVIAQVNAIRTHTEGTRIILNAGFRESVTALFVGHIRTVKTGHLDKATLETQIVAGDGDVAYSIAPASVGLAKGASAADAASKLAKAMGMDPDKVKKRLSEKDMAAAAKSLPRGYVYSGKASTAMTKLVDRFGLSWSIQDGQVQVLGPREVLPGQAIVLRPDTGLLDWPEPNDSQENKGPPTTSFKSLLQPEIRPGTALDVTSDFVKGLFRSEEVEHSGDTHGDDWLTQIKATAL